MKFTRLPAPGPGAELTPRHPLSRTACVWELAFESHGGGLRGGTWSASLPAAGGESALVLPPRSEGETAAGALSPALHSPDSLHAAAARA